MPIDLYYFPISPPCRALMVLSKTIGVHFNIIPVNIMDKEHMKTDYLKINPQHTVPTINDNGLILCESRAIMAYLITRYAKNDSLYPKDPRAKGMVDQRMNFELIYFFDKWRNAYGPVLMGLANEVNPDHIADLEKSFEILDKFLESSAFVAGDHLTIADFSTVTNIAQIKAFGFDINRYENVANWFKRCEENMEKYGFEEHIVQKGNDLAAAFLNNLKKE